MVMCDLEAAEKESDGWSRYESQFGVIIMWRKTVSPRVTWVIHNSPRPEMPKGEGCLMLISEGRAGIQIIEKGDLSIENWPDRVQALKDRAEELTLKRQELLDERVLQARAEDVIREVIDYGWRTGKESLFFRECVKWLMSDPERLARIEGDIVDE